MTRRLADVPREEIQPLFGGRLLLGKLSALAGIGGVGKSYLSAALAASVSRGDPLPGDEHSGGPAGVLLASFEDEAADTLRPRLEDLGADLTRVSVIDGICDQRGKVAPFTSADAAALSAEIQARGDVRLVIVDPVGGWLAPGVDEYRGSEVRSALEGLRQVAAEHQVAVLLVMHVRKAEADVALHRITGSAAFGQLVRSVLFAGTDPDDNQLAAVAHVKANLTGTAPTLNYQIEEHGQFAWLHERPDLDGERLAGRTPDEEHGARGEAETFLAATLEPGPRPAREIIAEASTAGIAERTLKRAKKRLDVRSNKHGPDGTWSWSLPHQQP
ncbi:AAA family ATPase [Egibacter rhizosphaerae]|uniref:AAA family ATPase n=1 Tax=Egibacter rhizosphaerae TaxID=1670831 RepID=UPI0013F15867|nr:AAA family ATPase [Egibacter rhizosphaerae]